MSIILHGYRYSVYSRIARMVLHAKGLTAEWAEIDPFGPLPDDHLALHPFGKVPALEHGDFAIYETGAICRYLDEAFDGPKLQPKGPIRRARMAQVIEVADNYGYDPLVRQVYTNAVFSPAKGYEVEHWRIHAGLDASRKVLAALDRLVAPNSAQNPTLGDLHLAGMIDAFASAREGAEVLAEYQVLSRWWAVMRENPSVLATRDGLLVMASSDSLS
ncbi:glutathione S-transferase family protein [Paracoccus sp. DMF-8]|uniref:glutathione S-transferase family protein n=1 Tax=Paracoccus sp. DMF-8 TaxID=3019445 RepID=UPI0023E7A3CB|nr:glutathione S-transferase family protein [Paracoccus sp. DMF-8]MDF3606889.1 glutathione S-transferase family protein [Paracoccus sp. DMF-8]